MGWLLLFLLVLVMLICRSLMYPDRIEQRNRKKKITTVIPDRHQVYQEESDSYHIVRTDPNKVVR